MSESRELKSEAIGISAQLEGTTFNLGVKSRFTTALDRLAGNIVHIPNWWIEAAESKKRAKDSAELAAIHARGDAQVALLTAEGEQAVRRYSELTAAGAHAIEGFVREQAIRQRNREAVAFETGEALRELPPPDISGDDELIDDDWLNVFAAFAEKASSGQLRMLWGRILAGEIRKPHTFSLTTLRVISELDKTVATTFEKVLQGRIGDNIYAPEQQGAELLDHIFLEESGLVQGAGGLLSLNIKKLPDGHFFLNSGNFALRMKPRKSSTDSLSLSIAKLSRVGREVASIISPLDEASGLRKVAYRLVADMEQITLLKASEDGVMRAVEL